MRRVLLFVLLWILVWGALSLLAFSLGGSDLGLSMFVIGTGSLLGGLLTGLILLPRRARQYAQRGQLECALRVVAGQHPGLGTRWQNGVGVLAPGRLTFHGYVGGVRFARRSALTIEVRRIDRSAARRTGWREAWSVRPGLDVCRLVSPSATLEWGLLGRQARWATARLSPAPVEGDA